MHTARKFISRAIPLVACGALVCTGAAFAAESSPAKKEVKPAASAPKTEAKSAEAPVVARVNGVDITRAEFDRAKKALLSQNSMMQPHMNAEMTKMVEESALNQLIAKELLYQAGKKLEIKDLNKQVADKVAQSKERFPSKEEYEKVIKEMGMTEKDVETFAREDTVINNLIEKEIAGKVSVSDADAKKFYDENTDKFKRDESVKASHILIGVDENATAEEKQKAKEKAESLLKKLKGGADFAETAKTESTCPSAPQGGDLGYFGKGQMVPEFEKAAFALKPGEVSQVVETQFGYHIIKLTDRKEAETAKFEDTKERIVEFLKSQRVQKDIAAYIENLKKTGKVEIVK